MIQRETPAPEHRRTPDTPVGPVRTCIGCRGRELAIGLLRVVARPGGNGVATVTVDSARTLPGRGAWLHPDGICLQAAVRRRAFARALRITGSPDLSGVIGHVESLSGSPVHQATEQVAKNMSTP
ncbi:MAG: DUF448 domain-containing protein [Actinobacteria bacterium]|nr:DUF448 domain-containing protein [Actinomycetota bacterium]